MPLNPAHTILIGTINVEDEGVTENVSYGGKVEVTRTVRVAWSDRWSLYAQLVGTGTTVAGAVTTRTGPLEYPDAPWLQADQVELSDMLGTPSVGANGLVAYDTCRLKIIYRTPEPGKSDSTNTEANITVDIGEEMLTLPNDQAVYRWLNGDPLPPDICSSLPMTVGTIKYSLKRQAGRPTSFFEKFVDTVNDEPFFGYPVGLCLYKGFSSNPVFSESDGTVQTNVVHNWKVRSNGGKGWNYFLKPGVGWSTIKRIDNNDPPFPLAHHQTIVGLP